MRRHPRCATSLEPLEDRLAPAVQLTYEGALGISLVELASGATPTVTISENIPTQLRIDLGGETFDAQSTAQGSQGAAGLTYQTGAPESSTYATLDISAKFWTNNQVINIVPLQANLAGDALTLGPITNAAGILGSITASANTITVNSLETSLPNAVTGNPVNANVDLRAAGALTVAGNAVLNTRTGSISLAAGVNADGTASSGGGTLTIAAGATVLSENPSNSDITLRGSDIAIDTSSNPAVVVATAGGEGIRTAQPGEDISVGANPTGGLALSNAELAQILTPAGDVVTFGDPTQVGTITFAGATPRAGLAAVQAADGPGSIALNSTAGTALAAGSGFIHLIAGTGGIVATGGGTAASIASTGQVILDTSGGIGSSTGRVLFDAAATPARVIVGTTGAPGRGVYLGGLGALTLGGVHTNAPLDVTAVGDLTLASFASVETGTGTIALAAGVNADGTVSSGGGTLTIAAGATVESDNTGTSAITLRGSHLAIDTSSNPAVVGRVSTTPTATLTGLNDPANLAFDADGNLFVANDTTVSVFSPGSTTPTATLTGLNNPDGLAFDAQGNLYVTNFDGTTVSVFTLPYDPQGNILPGNYTPNPDLTLTGLDGPGELAFDAHGNLFVINHPLGSEPPSVSVFKPGSTTPAGTLTGVENPTALAADGDGNVFVADFFANTVSVFNVAYDANGNLLPQSTTPTATLTGVNTPNALAIDDVGNLYVANLLSSNFGDVPEIPGTTVSVFILPRDPQGNILPGNYTPNPAFTRTGLLGPSALAFDARGSLYVANTGSTGPTVNTTVSMFVPGSSTPTRTLTGPAPPGALAVDPEGNLFVTNSIGNTVSEFSTTVPVPAAGGVVITTAKADQPITLGASSGTGLSLSDAELGRIAAKSFVTIGGATYDGDITVTGDVTTHPGYNTLYLQTQQLGRINATTGTILSVANLALQAGTGIGSTGAMAIDATQLAFASQSGAIQLNDANAVALTSVGTLTASSIPGDIFSSANVGGVFTLLTSGGGVSGQINYEGHALAEGATLTLADGNHYQISYRGNGGQDVTLTRIANLTLPPGPPSPLPPSPRPAPPAAGVSLVGRTLVVNGGAGNDVVKVMPHGGTLRVYASFLPAGVKFLAFRRASVKDVFIRLGDGNDIAKVSPRLRLPVVIEGGEGDDELIAGGGSSLLIGGPGSDLLAAGRTGRPGSILIGGSIAYDANDEAPGVPSPGRSGPRAARVGGPESRTSPGAAPAGSASAMVIPSSMPAR